MHGRTYRRIFGRIARKEPTTPLNLLKTKNRRLAERVGFVPRTASGTRAGRSLKSTRSDQTRLGEFGGEGGIRTHVPLTGQDAFEAPPLRPLRYLSVSC